MVTHKYRCELCGFTCKRHSNICPTCHSENSMKDYGRKFRFSKKNRKNPLRIEKSKSLKKHINSSFSEQELIRMECDILGKKLHDKALKEFKEREIKRKKEK